ncbi:MAG: class GN sortase [Gammaproteobacteria bacterium]|nr:class GN sortase [Gammaproteobacteria bacterium]MDH5801464.1 class GN sortase [Gammaproteobacteria bacterium]
MLNSKPYKFAVLALLIAGLGLTAKAVYIPLKAQLAQVLLQQAWEKNLAAGDNRHKPWPWADTRPVARLRVQRLDQDLIVLAGNQGNSLAFAPGLVQSEQMPGFTVISAHRDTHFRFVQDLRDGDVLCLQRPARPDVLYSVEKRRVIDVRNALWVSSESSGEELMLITCYPFNALQTGGSQRYVVLAAQLPQGSTCTPGGLLT